MGIYLPLIVFGTVLGMIKRMQKKMSPFKGLRTWVRRQMKVHAQLPVKHPRHLHVKSLMAWVGRGRIPETSE